MADWTSFNESMVQNVVNKLKKELPSVMACGHEPADKKYQSPVSPLYTYGNFYIVKYFGDCMIKNIMTNVKYRTITLDHS